MLDQQGGGYEIPIQKVSFLLTLSIGFNNSLVPFVWLGI